MNGLRFKVGEMAILAVALRRHDLLGTHVSVEKIHQRPAGSACVDNSTLLVACDYIVEHVDGSKGSVADWQLRKIDPPAEPASLTRQCEEGIEA